MNTRKLNNKLVNLTSASGNTVTCKFDVCKTRFGKFVMKFFSLNSSEDNATEFG